MKESEILDSLSKVIDREIHIDPIEAVHSLMSGGGKLSEHVPLHEIAFGFDANAFLQIPRSKKFADIIDYFDGMHRAPIVLPGQVIQEFWNNQYVALHNTSSSIKNKLDQLEVEMKRVDPRFGEFSGKFKDLLDSMTEEFGYLKDPKIMENIATFCKLLLRHSSRKYVVRSRFHEIAIHRKNTRTPPGFKDDGDGDFFVWLDFLYNLAYCKGGGSKFDHCILITDDKKIDWSLNGMAHPILVAEAKAMLGVNFEIWSLAKLEERVAKHLGKNK